MSEAQDQYRTGLELLADPAAAAEWRRAVGLVDTAADAGHAAALERRALFECMGVGRKADWTKALDSLTQAAGRGSQTAARQLILLAEDRFATDSGSHDWAALRSRVSIPDHFRAPSSETLSANPLIRSIPSFASRAECQWLIATAAPRLERAIVYSNETGESGADPGRTNQFALFDFVHLDLIIEMIRARLAAAIGAPLPCLEVSQVLRYSVGEEFAPHWDYLDPVALGEEVARRGQRAVTALVYLNDDFEGGETSFPDLGFSHRGKTGDALVFSNVDPAGRPDERTKHAGCPPTRGEKWLFSQWVRDRIPSP
jgi:prolyl 4-hydroxylase